MGTDTGDAPTNPTLKKERKQEIFLKKLAMTANVSESAEAAKVDRTTVYQWKKEDPAFAAAWEAAIEISCDELEAKAFERAKRKSDTLLIFLLKAHRPERYRETSRHEVTGANGGPIQSAATIDLKKLTPEELRQLRDIVAKSTPDEPPDDQRVSETP